VCIRPETSFDTQGLLIRSIISLLSVCRQPAPARHIKRNLRARRDYRLDLVKLQRS
jgi:hypothetical protein